MSTTQGKLVRTYVGTGRPVMVHLSETARLRLAILARRPPNGPKASPGPTSSPPYVCGASAMRVWLKVKIDCPLPFMWLAQYASRYGSPSGKCPPWPLSEIQPPFFFLGAAQPTCLLTYGRSRERAETKVRAVLPVIWWSHLRWPSWLPEGWCRKRKRPQLPWP